MGLLSLKFFQFRGADAPILIGRSKMLRPVRVWIIVAKVLQFKGADLPVSMVEQNETTRGVKLKKYFSQVDIRISKLD